MMVQTVSGAMNQNVYDNIAGALNGAKALTEAFSSDTVLPKLA